jgi:hypothetical protein
MPFEITAFMPYLTRFGAEAAKPITISAAEQQNQKNN